MEIPVLDNDYDPDSDSLHIAAVGQGWSGIVDLSEDKRTITFTPGANDTGSVDFVYYAADPSGARGEGHVHVTLISVNDTPTVSITAPVDSARFSFGQTILLKASGRDEENRLARVSFYKGEMKLGDAVETDGEYQYEWENAELGLHRIHAEAVDEEGLVSVGEEIGFVVSGWQGVGYPINSAVMIDLDITRDGIPHASYVEFPFDPGSIVPGDSNLGHQKVVRLVGDQLKPVDGMNAEMASYSALGVSEVGSEIYLLRYSAYNVYVEHWQNQWWNQQVRSPALGSELIVNTPAVTVDNTTSQPHIFYPLTELYDTDIVHVYKDSTGGWTNKTVVELKETNYDIVHLDVKHNPDDDKCYLAYATESARPGGRVTSVDIEGTVKYYHGTLSSSSIVASGSPSLGITMNGDVHVGGIDTGSDSSVFVKKLQGEYFQSAIGGQSAILQNSKGARCISVDATGDDLYVAYGIGSEIHIKRLRNNAWVNVPEGGTPLSLSGPADEVVLVAKYGHVFLALRSGNAPNHALRIYQLVE